MLLLFVSVFAATQRDADVTLAVDPGRCQPGEEVTVSVDTAPAGSTCQWMDDTEEPGHFADPDASTTTWTCPDVSCPGALYHPYATCSSPEGNTDFAFLAVRVRCVADEEAEQGCATAPTAPTALWTLALTLLVATRRRSRP
jgi:MYXO-CTERM domain-containing protein